jgi:peptidyl-prolyl cis-trans isomerase C
MKKNLSYPATIAVGLVVTLLLPVVVVGLATLVAVRATALPDDAAFRIYGAAVTKTELKHRLAVLKALYGLAPPADPAGQDLFRRQSAQAVAFGMVLDRQAQEQGVGITGSAAKTLLAQFVDQKFQGGPSGFAQMLGEVGASEQDVLDEVKRQQNTGLLFDKVVRQEGHAGQVTGPQVQQYYDQHPAQFLQPEGRHLRHIVVPSEDDANQVVAQARGGADFAALAKQFSLDEATRDNGGDLGMLAQRQLEPVFGQPAFSTPSGGVFGPVETDKGWDIGQVLEVRPATQLTFDQVRNKLQANMQAGEELDYWRAWVNRQIGAADIEYADEYRPAKPDISLASQSGVGVGAPTGGEPPR